MGWKRQLIPEIIKILPEKFNNYVEPFIGGGALFFYLSYNKSIINDSNFELINLYKEIAKNPDKIINELKNYINDEKILL